MTLSESSSSIHPGRHVTAISQNLEVGDCTSDLGKHSVQNLGAFRLFLALLVVYQHNEKLAFGNVVTGWIQGLEIGSLAVLAFFSMSGYVIVGAIDHFYSNRPISFIVNRLNRVLPLYVVVVLGSMLLLAPFALDGRLISAEGVLSAPEALSFRNLFANLVWVFPFGNKLVSPIYTFVPIAWAVRTEIMFYLCAFFVLCLSIFLKEKFVKVGFLSSILFLALALVELTTGVLGFPSFLFAPHFIFGGALYHYRKTNSWSALFVVVIAAVLMGAELLHRPPLHEIMGFARYQLAQLGILGLLIGILVAGSYRNPVPADIDRRYGEYSYPLYICHLLPLLVCVALGALQSPSWLWFVASVTGACFLSGLLVRLVERPVAQLRDVVRKIKLA